MQQRQMSARAFQHILKPSLGDSFAPIDDPTGNSNSETAHLAQAIQYRPRRTTRLRTDTYGVIRYTVPPFSSSHRRSSSER
jgi:hypothetical protein